jgi:hypothetical protein
MKSTETVIRMTLPAGFVDGGWFSLPYATAQDRRFLAAVESPGDGGSDGIEGVPVIDGGTRI